MSIELRLRVDGKNSVNLMYVHQIPRNSWRMEHVKTVPIGRKLRMRERSVGLISVMIGKSY